MASNWYYATGGNRNGPVSLEQLKSLLASGQVVASDNVWRDGMANWMPAGQVAELGGHAMPPPAPMPFVPPTPGVPMSMRPEPWDQTRKTMRIVLIVAAGIATLCFFTPQFYALSSISAEAMKALKAAKAAGVADAVPDMTAGYVVWGWDTWFGITVFILSWFALAAAIVDLCLRKIRLMPVILQWVHLGFFSLMGLLSLVGTILGIFGVRMATSFCIPITAILNLLGVAMGTTVAIMIVVKYRSRA